MKIMASNLITSWQRDGGKVETVTDFISLVSKITVDGDCSDKIKGHLLLGRKAMTNLESILKSRCFCEKYYRNFDRDFIHYYRWLWVL